MFRRANCNANEKIGIDAAGVACEQLPANSNVPKCGVGPMEAQQDPCPTCDGLWFTGAAHSWTVCAVSVNADIDDDDVDDNCERQLAEGFAPLLVKSPTDAAPRYEPYWAANASDRNQKMIQIFYAYGYNDDGGVPGTVPVINAHHGDSEFVVVTVKFSNTGRWILFSVDFSAHGSVDKYYYWDIEFPVGGEHDYPLVWVAKSKHANYPNDFLCSVGGFNGADACPDNYPIERFPVGWYKNLGSSWSPMINCVLSTNTSLYHGEECFWTDSKFRGWYIDSEAEGVAPYKDALANFGF